MSTALLIIDVQQALCSGVGEVFEAARVIESINLAAAKARAARVLVVGVLAGVLVGVLAGVLVDGVVAGLFLLGCLMSSNSSLGS